VGQKSNWIRFRVEHRYKSSDLLEGDGVGLEDIDAHSCGQQDGYDLSAGDSALWRDAGCAFETVGILSAIGIQFQRHVFWCQELDITTAGARQPYRCHSHPFAVTFVIAANSDCVTPLLRNMAIIHDSLFIPSLTWLLSGFHESGRIRLQSGDLAPVMHRIYR
jgi:hypothetical protein